MLFALLIESETFGWNAKDRRTGSKARLLMVAPEVQGIDLFTHSEPLHFRMDCLPER
jgi:hypothetical protein